MKKQKLGEVLKRIWKMTAPYWLKSEERWEASRLGRKHHHDGLQ